MIHFDEQTHTYTHDGVVVPGVTTSIKEAGLIVETFFTQEARDRGVAVHALCEAFISYGVDEAPAELAGYLAAFKRFLAETGFVVESSERRLFHPVHWYAGTGDLFGMLNEQFTYLDIKSGGKAKDHPIQTAAYVEAFWHETKRPVIQRGCLYLADDGTYKLDFHKNNQRDLAVWLAVATIANYKRQ